MIESIASIQDTLHKLGIELQFPDATIYGISEQKIEDISDYSSPFGVIKSVPAFLLAVSDIKEVGIVEGTQFYIQVFNRKITFAAGTYTEDFSGWAKLLVTIIGVEDV